MLPQRESVRLQQRASRWQADGVPDGLARHLARLIVLPSACDIVRASEVSEVDTATAGRLYFIVGEQLGFGWLREQAEALNAAGYWQRLAISAVIEELYAHQREVTQQNSRRLHSRHGS